MYSAPRGSLELIGALSESEIAAVETLVMSFISALTDAGFAEGNPGKVFIIIPRSRTYLADLLIKAFEGREDVEIIVDRRRGERRTQERSVAVERRQGARRRPKEAVIEVVVGMIGPAGEPHQGFI